MNVRKSVVISVDFSEAPGGRHPVNGPKSGQEFRERFLEQNAQSGTPLLIDLDGTYGYSASFLDEAFGGLARKFGVEKTLALLFFKSDERPYLIPLIVDRYMKGN